MQQSPAFDHPLQRWQETLWLLIALLTPLFVNLWVEQQSEASKVWLFRTLVWLLALVWLSGWLHGLRTRPLPVSIRNLIIALVPVLLLSTLLSTNRDIAFYGTLDRAGGLLWWLRAAPRWSPCVRWISALGGVVAFGVALLLLLQLRLLLVLLLLLLVPIGVATARSSTTFVTQRTVLVGGGSTESASFSVTAVIGQAGTEKMAAASYKVSGGFLFPLWHSANEHLWLPLIHK